MNYIKHLTGFFNKINNENTINPTHISLYLSLFQCWNVNRFKNPTGISREEIMKASKAQLDNGVITSSDYIREMNAADQARQNLLLHQLQLIQTELDYNDYIAQP